MRASMDEHGIAVDEDSDVVRLRQSEKRQRESLERNPTERLKETSSSVSNL
jgi:hypothetical protein